MPVLSCAGYSILPSVARGVFRGSRTVC